MTAFNKSWIFLEKENNQSSATEQSPLENSLEFGVLPYDVRDEFTEEYMETGQGSLMQDFLMTLLERDERMVQDMVQKIYYDAVRFDRRKSIWNIMVVISQLPYDRIKPWAAFIALAATRSKYHEIQELGIRCYENWEDKEACGFLQGCFFTETWLQEYADEVAAFVMEEGKSNVLCEKNKSWKMAGGGENSECYTAGYSSRYSNDGTENQREHTIHMAG